MGVFIMKNTKNCMTSILGEIANAKLDDVTLLATLSEDAQVAKVFVDNFGLFQNIASKFHSIDTDTKVSIILENIAKGCANFDPTKGAKLNTLCKFYIANDFKRFIRDQENDKRVANSMTESMVVQDSEGNEDVKEPGVCDDTTRLEILDLIENSLDFTETEKKFMRLVISDQNIKDAEIAKEIGVARCTITKAKKGLAKKLVSIGFTC